MGNRNLVEIVSEYRADIFEEKVEQYIKNGFEVSSTDCAVSSITRDGSKQGAISICNSNHHFVAIMVRAGK